MGFLQIRQPSHKYGIDKEEQSTIGRATPWDHWSHEHFQMEEEITLGFLKA